MNLDTRHHASKTNEHAMKPLNIPPPDPSLEPLKSNVFERVAVFNTMLAPLFPYKHPGAMVPAPSLAVGAPGRRFQMFRHSNSVDEIAVILASHGIGRGKSGHMFVGPKEHHVNLSFSDPNDPANYVLIVVTQRQSDDWESQHEQVAIVCEQCQEPLYTHAYSAGYPPATAEQGMGAPSYPGFHTLLESARAATSFNADPSLRECRECGYINPEFGLDDWGWNRYSEQSVFADQAAKQLAKEGEN